MIRDNKADHVHICWGHMMGELRSSKCNHVGDILVLHLGAGS